MCQHFPLAFIYIKSFFALSWIMEIFINHTDDSCHICSCVWDLRKPGERCGTQWLWIEGSQSPVLLPPYLGYLSPLVSDSQHIPNALGFPYRKSELASLFWMGKTAVALAISHGRYWERLERRTLTSDLLLFQASLRELRDTPIPTPTIF